MSRSNGSGRTAADGWPAPTSRSASEALCAARRVGYYDVPRSGSVADVAEAIECSPSTAGAHLRKGEAALVDTYLDG